MLKFTQLNLERKRDLSRAHNANAEAKKVAAAKRTLLLQQQAGKQNHFFTGYKLNMTLQLYLKGQGPLPPTPHSLDMGIVAVH